ncbi:MAG TPA: multifunctional oxoglutarate decarboxylase/oxoglutarate dehydrogenase thiamine pyrophosphate-binding subunit/dihydrolipoyllysine-residue succinyltransferase subunit [Thermoanaerobaculia bacterium]|nr:multifunctional oxoglutarate decarboxylase/oxoglutarate dehydrogenase thiamine pyrophosphate-binding subunit/dihydrolipoyllysine-residue succinyltransferase subunit [Thermoanaerobaculia bacterium]
MATTKPDLDIVQELVTEFGDNASYVADLLARYRTNPEGVDEEWRAFFRDRLGETAPVTAPAPPPPGQPRPDVEPAPPKPAAAPAAPAAPRTLREGEQAEPLRGASLRVAQNMDASLAVPTATSQRLIPVKLLEENRRLINDYRASRDESKVSFTHLIAWAILRALDDFPRLNDAFDESGGSPVRIRRERVNFGIAVDVEKKDGSRSLVVPNVKDAGAMDFARFLAASDDVVSRARAGKLEVSDFEGTTISLTNPGTLGTTASVPRLMPGQGVIVATGAMEYPGEFRAMSPEALSQLAVSKVVTFTSTYDHRIIQGAESGAFLARIEELLLGGRDFYEKVFAALGIFHKPFHWAVDFNPAFSADGSGNRSGEIAKQARVLELINAYRVRGHLIADIDPLRMMALQTHPELDLETYGLTIWDLDRSFWTGGLAGGDHMPLREIIGVMRRVYCGKVGTEYRHISSPTEKYWVRKHIAAAAEGKPLPVELRKRLLGKLVAAESFERFLGTRFLGQRRYSIEGAETAIAVLDQLVEGAADRGVEDIVMGVTHRGRLNILANVVGNSTERLFAAFEGTVHPDFPADEGDVKYHQGARTTLKTASGREIRMTVPSNPSHLEAVDPVVEGRARAKEDLTGLPRAEATARVLPVILHGDAAFAGQGIVAEVFNLSQLHGYRTGGTIHIVINNQIGFTTDPAAGRSSLYSTDVAKIVQVPIFHVNADDPEAAWRILQIALDYRQEWHKDVVIDLIGFRRHGHNEGDEPTYTQPLMYKRIQEHPGVRALYAKRLVKEGVLSDADIQQLEERQHAFYEESLAAAKAKGEKAGPPTADHPGDSGRVEEVATAVPRETLARIGRVLTTVPSGFNLNPKMVQQLARRAKMTEGSASLDWATAEALAFGSLLLDGVPIRMSGQDSARGTFSQRHVVFHDTQTGQTWTPLCSLAQCGPEGNETQPTFQIYDSPLSEAGVLGFEYGYSVESPRSLVIWEAQYGDFANGAQVIIDQFVSSAEDKWRETSRLSMLLPHGYEGQGPEHSSARIERYLPLCADENMSVCNVTTPAQYFHLLRRQMLNPRARPLILFTPKSLLRFPASFSPIESLEGGGFNAVMDDPERANLLEVKRLLFCSGKVFYDLQAERAKRKSADIAIIRLEQLYPFPMDLLRSLLSTYPAAKDAFWVQEEPQNMGPWTFITSRLVLSTPLHYAGRPASPSPATGNASVHKAELANLLSQAFGSAASSPR